MQIDKWHVSYDTNGDEATATVHLPPCHHMRVEVATVDCLAMEEVDGDMEVVREGPDSWRLQNVCLIVHAPDMLAVINSVAAQLAEICDETLPARDQKRTELAREILNRDENWELWRYLTELQEDLERVADEAVDLDTI